MEDNSQQGTKKSGWRTIGWLCAALVIIFTLIGLWWWHSDADLEDVYRQAKTKNIPTSWEEIGLTRSSPDRLACWERIVVLSGQLPTYDRKKNYDDPYFKAYEPIPEPMRAYHAALDPMLLGELDKELLLLGDQPLCFEESFTYDTKLPEIGHYRELIRLLNERIALSDPSTAKKICISQLALCRTFPRNVLIGHLVRASLINITFTSITSHIKYLSENDARELADDFALTTNDLDKQLMKSLIGEFQCNLTVLSKRSAPLAFNQNWYMPFVLRSGRHYLLTEQLNYIDFMLNHTFPEIVVWNKEQMIKFSEERKGIPTPGLILKGLLYPAHDVIMSMTYETILKSQLIQAELLKKPWPIDIFDTSGKPLRPITLHGKIIGAYTVGVDGVDNGGDTKKDKYFPLYGKHPSTLPTSP